MLQIPIGFSARRGIAKQQCCTPLVLYTMKWGHLQYPFDELASANARRRCGAVSKGQAHLLNPDAAPMLLPKLQVGSNTTQYHPIPPQYHFKIPANTLQNDDPHAPPQTEPARAYYIAPPPHLRIIQQRRRPPLTRNTLAQRKTKDVDVYVLCVVATV